MLHEFDLHTSKIVYLHFLSDSGNFSTKKQGNCLRFFALQTASAGALRTVFDNIADTFENKKTKFVKHCESENMRKLSLSKYIF